MGARFGVGLGVGAGVGPEVADRSHGDSSARRARIAADFIFHKIVVWLRKCPGHSAVTHFPAGKTRPEGAPARLAVTGQPSASTTHLLAFNRERW